jgi:hypothetical protein
VLAAQARHPDRSRRVESEPTARPGTPNYNTPPVTVNATFVDPAGLAAHASQALAPHYASESRLWRDWREINPHGTYLQFAPNRLIYNL